MILPSLRDFMRNTVLNASMFNLIVLSVVCGILLFLCTGTVFCEGIEEIPESQQFKELHVTENLKAAKSTRKRSFCGIYAFKCLETGAMYIGSAVELSNRIIDHITNNGSNIRLQNAKVQRSFALGLFYFLCCGIL